MAAEKAPGVIFPMPFRDLLEGLDRDARGQILTDAFAIAYPQLGPMEEGTEGVGSALYKAALKQLTRIVEGHIKSYNEISKRNSENINKRWHKDAENDTTKKSGNTTEKSRNTKNTSRNTTEKKSYPNEDEEENEGRRKKEEDEVRSKTASAAASSTDNNFSTGGPGFKQGREIIGNLYPDLKAKYEAEESGTETGPQVHDPPTAELAAAQRRLEELKRQKT